MREATWAEGKAQVSRVKRMEGPWAWMEEHGRLSVRVTVQERVLAWARAGSSRQHSAAVVRVGGAHLTSQLLPISSWFLSGVHFLEVEMGLISASPGL